MYTSCTNNNNYTTTNNNNNTSGYNSVSTLSFSSTGTIRVLQMWLLGDPGLDAAEVSTTFNSTPGNSDTAHDQDMLSALLIINAKNNINAL